MITFQSGDYLFHHNSDGSGEVLVVKLATGGTSVIVRKEDGSGSVRVETRPDAAQGPIELSISCEALIEFAAELVRTNKVERLESMSARAILGMK